jgi:tetratricopeptide (TPR) repeat protein
MRTCSMTSRRIDGAARQVPAAAGGHVKVALGAVLLAPLLSLLLATPAQAQLGDSIPSTAYYGSFPIFYDGEYRGALGAFQNDLRGGIKSPTSRWVDSICYYTMCGECYYHMGQFPDALNQYTSALKLYSAFFDWMMRVQFPAQIPYAGPGARIIVPWGASRRNTKIGQFPDSFNILQGQVNNNNVIAQGGVVQQAMLVPVRVSEIIRATTLAIRRRRELMGPVCKYDPLTNELISLLSRRPAPPNNWSQVWVDVQLGAAYASAGNVAQAATALERSLVVGDMDHPLTATALLELGQLALQTGDLTSAGRYFEEATYAAATFSDPGLMEEAFRLGEMAHLLSNAKGIYPPLGPAIIWSQQRGLRQLNASLLILAAESFAVLGQTPKAVVMIGDASRSIGRRAMVQGSIGARLNLVTALANYQTNQVPAGDAALATAMAYQHTGSLWMFHINLVDNLYQEGSIFDRVATLLYDYVLRDPTPVDWATSPLESLSVLMTPHPLPYEHWFEATLKRNKEPELALEIADRARRHRFFSTLPMGGRLLGLRWVLEGPQELLNEQSLLQRQDLLAKYTRYHELATEAKKLEVDLMNKPVVDDAIDARREQTRQLGALGTVSQSQEVILREIGVRREPAEMLFPPLRKTKDVQLALPEGHALLAFFATGNEASGNLYGFLFTKQKYAMWKIASPAQLRRYVGQMLREMGNTDHNRPITPQELERETWKKSATKVVELLFEKSNVDLSAKFEELVIVPDGLLWYLPFEALPIGKKDDAKPLITQVRVRYSPTVGLSIPYHRLQKPNPGPTGVVMGKLYPHDDDSVAQAAFEPLSRAVDGAVALPRNPTATSSLLRMLLEGLIVLDEIKPADGPYAWSPVPPDGGKPGGALLAWLALPWGGPLRVILPGFHTAAENGLHKGTVNGNDLFLAVCGLMSTGTRTVLISRWRTAGQTSFELVREFAQELAHTSAADAWQRAVELVGEQPLDSEAEPRLKKVAGIDLPKSDHPFFWAAYLLADSGRLAENQEPPPPPVLNGKKNAPVPAAGDVKPPDKKAAGRDALPPAAIGPPIPGGPPGAGQAGAGQAPAGDGAMGGSKRGKAAKDPAQKKPPRTAKGKAAAAADQP